MKHPEQTSLPLPPKNKAKAQPRAYGPLPIEVILRRMRANTRDQDGSSLGLQFLPLETLQYPRYVHEPHPTTPNHMFHARTRSIQVHDNPTRSKGIQLYTSRSAMIQPYLTGWLTRPYKKPKHSLFAYGPLSLELILPSRWLSRGQDGFA